MPLTAEETQRYRWKGKK
uniref:Uncharacterized protein n=1 Tax=Anguilla anguilla TaxID=7936 RepID=A0A0E9STN8_ANGAN